MSKSTDVRSVAAELYLLPIATRVPLKFGPETTSHVTLARVRVRVADRAGRTADGWGETPLSVTWVWPSTLTYDERHRALTDAAGRLTSAWADFDGTGHPVEVGTEFTEQRLPEVLESLNEARTGREPVPWLAALVCSSPFDLALHDAYGKLLERPVYETYNAAFMNRDLSAYLTPAEGSDVSFEGMFPEDFLVRPRPTTLPAWHLVGGTDPVSEGELTGDEPDDGFPILLGDWIDRDGLTCLKVKLRGDDAEWDYKRLISVGMVAQEHGSIWLTSDFNCTVREPAYVCDILDRLAHEHPRIWQMLLYVEQPFPYDLEQHRIDVHSVSARKPLFMDESAHDWRLVELGRSLGWTGVALKTCKTQSGALLALCWSKTHGMTLMVQDLTNPMIAQIPHVLLAAHAGTIMGVETNAMQFYPKASLPEAAVHPGLYQRHQGSVDLTTVAGPGFGYRLDNIDRCLPPPTSVAGDWA